MLSVSEFQKLACRSLVPSGHPSPRVPVKSVEFFSDSQRRVQTKVNGLRGPHRPLMPTDLLKGALAFLSLTDLSFARFLFNSVLPMNYAVNSFCHSTWQNQAVAWEFVRRRKCTQNITFAKLLQPHVEVAQMQGSWKATCCCLRSRISTRPCHSRT